MQDPNHTPLHFFSLRYRLLVDNQLKYQHQTQDIHLPGELEEYRVRNHPPNTTVALDVSSDISRQTLSCYGICEPSVGHGAYGKHTGCPNQKSEQRSCSNPKIVLLPRRTTSSTSTHLRCVPRGIQCKCPRVQGTRNWIPIHHGITHSDLGMRGPPIDGPTLEAGQSHGIPYN